MCFKLRSTSLALAKLIFCQGLRVDLSSHFVYDAGLAFPFWWTITAALAVTFTRYTQNFQFHAN